VDTSFDELIEQLRKSDDAAADRVFRRFQGQLINLASKHLEPRLRPKVDAEDVVQSVFRTVFRRLADGQFELEGWDSLWGLLTRITVRKCHKWHEHFHNKGRDVNREVASPAAPSGADFGWDPADRKPTPAEAAALAETVQELLRGLNEREQQIVTLRLQGYNLSEIAKQVRCTFRKAKEVVNFVQGRLQRMRKELQQT
jgi:RNA polymerase sigma-70 factor (ECF subfamily)